MEKFQKFCITSLKGFVGIALITIIIAAILINSINLTNGNDKFFSYQLIGIITLSTIAGIFIILSKATLKLKVIFLLLIAFFIRLWWILNAPSVLVSDFKTMYLAAKDLISGNLNAFKNFGYLARFPHLICTTLYMALMIILFPFNHLLAIKTVNLALSVLTVYLMYNLSSFFTKNEKTRLSVMLISSIFPAFIAYSSTYCTENLAYPLYLLTAITFFQAINSNKLLKWFTCGVLLALSNLFRGVGVIFLIAFIIYIFVFTKENKIKNSVSFLSGMIGTSLLISFILMITNVINMPLWKGTEPAFTLLLKGTNVEAMGRWNSEDANFVSANLGNPDLAKQCIDKSIERISNLSLIGKIKFFGIKFLSQWSAGDYNGTYWAFLETDMILSKLVPISFQIVFIIIMVLSFISLLTNKNSNENALLHILLCGFGLLFMFIETQSRYSYIISWVFIIMASQGIETLTNIIKKPSK